MKKVLTIGEIMLRLQPPNTDRFRQAHSFDIAFGGGEANVAVCLAQLGIDARFFTALPNNGIGFACRDEIRKYGVDVSKIVYSGERLGIYYCEKGCSERPSRVIYDRKHSAFAEIDYNDIDIDSVLDGVNWLHFTGITPALSINTEALIKRVLIRAKELGITISCDLNYRAKLWSENKANIVMSALMKYVDVVIANEEDAKKVFGISADDSDIENGKLSIDGYKKVSKKIEEKFNIKTVAITLRESFSASRNGWSALIYHNGEYSISRRYDMTVLDRVGGGDSFSAGLIYALISDMDGQSAVDYAVACSCLKHSVNGDFNIISHDEIIQLIKGGSSGRVQR